MCCYIKPLCTYLEKSSLDPDSLVKLMVTGQTPKLFPVQNYVTWPVDFLCFYAFCSLGVGKEEWGVCKF